MNDKIINEELEVNLFLSDDARCCASVYASNLNLRQLLSRMGCFAV